MSDIVRINPRSTQWKIDRQATVGPPTGNLGGYRLTREEYEERMTIEMNNARRDPYAPQARTTSRPDSPPQE